jgi:hypothetical protein
VKNPGTLTRRRRVRDDVRAGLGLTDPVEQHLAELTAALDAA